MELSEDGIAFMKLDSKAGAKEAKEERAKESATIADQPGIFREGAPNRTREMAKARDFKNNATSVEKLDIQPANAPRAKEMRKDLGAREDTKEHGAEEDSKQKAKESGKLVEMKHTEILIGTIRLRNNCVTDTAAHHHKSPPTGPQ